MWRQRGRAGVFRGTAEARLVVLRCSWSGAWTNVVVGAELDILVGTCLGKVVNWLLVVRLEGPAAASMAAGGRTASRQLLPSTAVAPTAVAADEGYEGGRK